MEFWTTIITGLTGSGILTVIIKSILDRRKNEIDHAILQMEQWKKIVDEYEVKYDNFFDDHAKQMDWLRNAMNERNEANNLIITELKANIETLQITINNQAETIETLTQAIQDLNAQNLRHRLIIAILEAQIVSMDKKPLISLKMVDLASDAEIKEIAQQNYISTENLEDIARSMKNIQNRREAKD